MRGLVPGLATPRPLGASLPGLYQDDRFVQQMCAGLDDVLAPVLATLDSLDAYLDPATAPEDMLPWLATWVGLTLDPMQATQRQRALVRAGAQLHRWRGTVRGISDAVEVLFGAAPTVVENGGARWSAASDSSLPGEGRADLLVSLAVPEPGTVDVQRLDAVVAAVKPAHVPHRVEVIPTTPG
jgi:phage tail-like protein